MQGLAARFRSPLAWWLLPAVLFGILHWNPVEFGGDAWLAALAATVIGLVLGHVAAATGNLSVAMGLHFANNVFAMLVLAVPSPVAGFSLWLAGVGAGAEAATLRRGLLLLDLATTLAAYAIWLRSRPAAAIAFAGPAVLSSRTTAARASRPRMNWISNYVRPKINSLFSRREVPENLWVKCDNCGTMLFHRELADNLNVCTNCGHHLAISPRERFRALFDGGVFVEVPVPKPLDRPARLQGPEEVSRPPARGAQEDRRGGGDAGRRGRDRPAEGGLRRPGLRLHGRLDGHACRQRHRRRRRARGEAQVPAGALRRRRRRADAGGDPQPDADAALDGRGARC